MKQAYNYFIVFILVHCLSAMSEKEVILISNDDQRISIAKKIAKTSALIHDIRQHCSEKNAIEIPELHSKDIIRLKEYWPEAIGSKKKFKETINNAEISEFVWLINIADYLLIEPLSKISKRILCKKITSSEELTKYTKNPSEYLKQFQFSDSLVDNDLAQKILSSVRFYKKNEIPCTHVIKAIAFSYDGTLLATGEHNGDVKIWSLLNNTIINNLLVNESIKQIFFNYNNSLLVSISNNNNSNWTMSTWDIYNGIKKATKNIDHADIITSDGKNIIYSKILEKKLMTIEDLSEQDISDKYKVYYLRYNPDGTLVGARKSNNQHGQYEIIAFDNNNNETVITSIPSGLPFDKIGCSKGNKKVAVTTNLPTCPLIIFDTQEENKYEKNFLNVPEITQLEFDHTADLLAISTYKNYTKIREISRKKDYNFTLDINNIPLTLSFPKESQEIPQKEKLEKCKIMFDELFKKSETNIPLTINFNPCNNSFALKGKNIVELWQVVTPEDCKQATLPKILSLLATTNKIQKIKK